MARYGDFLLTDAVRPSYDLKVVPKQGFRHDFYRDEESKTKVPVLMGAAIAREAVRRVHGPARSAGLRSRRGAGNEPQPRQSAGHTDLYREHIDLPVLKSILCDYEDLLLNDGCTGIAVLNPAGPHGSAVRRAQAADRVRHRSSREFEQNFRDHGVRCDDQMKFITEAEHVHSSSEQYSDQFEELKMRLGMEIGYC